MRPVRTWNPLKKGEEWDAGWIDYSAGEVRVRVSVLCKEEEKTYVVYSQEYRGSVKGEYRELSEFSCEDCAKAFALILVYPGKRAYCMKHNSND